MTSIREEASSRLIQNSENIRTRLKTRNIYSIGMQYPTKTNSVSNRILDSVNSLAQIVTPFSGFDLRNTVFGRAIEDRTPLTEFGLVMLGKQFAMNITKRAANQVIPIIKPSNLLPWRDGKLITNRRDLSITVDRSIGGFQRFIENAIHFYPNSGNPFTANPTNEEYLENTGKAQLDFLYGNINKNLFTSAGIRIFAGDDNVPTRVQNIVPNKFYFTKTGNRRKDFHPYFSTNYLSVLKLWEEEANRAMQVSLEYLADSHPDYGADLEYITEVLGTFHRETGSHKTDLFTNDNNTNSWINNDNGFSLDAKEKIIWGRDGITTNTDSELSSLRGIDDNVFGDTTNVLRNKFNVRGGLLEYTRNLINSKGGHGSGDITRKVFTNDDKIVGFNGSGLWKAPSNALERFRGRVGIRQHSALDQYGSFAKAIRFDGNYVYGGNPNSVIYKSVLPKIHPIISEETGKIDARNLMFSIENLAVEVISSDDKFGTIDDEFGTQIPKSEVGQLNGRLMWFPPYNLEITEGHTSNFESTVMVGRNEPMYNYMHSERTGSIRFSLIIDYPPQLKNYRGIDKHKKIAEFFAFGGDLGTSNNPIYDELKKREKDIEDKINELKSPPQFIESIMPNINQIKISFPNDWPLENDENSMTIFQNMYNQAYEINRKVPFSQSLEGSQFGLNENIFYPKGIRLDSLSNQWFFVQFEAEQLDQYNYNPRNPIEFNTTDNLETFDSMLLTKLDKYLMETFNTVSNRQLIRIKIDAGSSKLFFDMDKESDYNFKLGQRRANATKNFVNARLKALLGKDAKGLGIQFNLRGIDGTGSIGSTEADIRNATRDRINARETKEERFALISFERTEVTPQVDDINLTTEQRQVLENLEIELENIKKLINQNKKLHNRDLFREKTAGSTESLNDSGKISGWGNVAQNYYSSAFHSQTPEDFHRRLTFLHQCMRQGAAKRYNIEIDDTGTPRARNSVFGRQPICILRIGDFINTKIIIDNLTIDYNEAPWDTNPEGFGMQPMIANITLSIKIMGGQSLKTPIDVLQNAGSFNYYANSTFSDNDVYRTASHVAALEEAYRLGINDLRDTDGKLKTFEQVQAMIERTIKANSNSE